MQHANARLLYKIFTQNKNKISVGYLWHYEALGRISVGKHYKAGYIICRESSFECGTQTGRQGERFDLQSKWSRCLRWHVFARPAQVS